MNILTPENLATDFSVTDELLKDRVIVVTGAGDGIGRAAALTYAKHGATVVLVGKTVEKLEYVYDQIESLGAPSAAIYPIHFEGATPHDYDEMANILNENFGRIDGLLHNAAIHPYLSRIKDYDPEDWMKVMQVNLNAPFLITQSLMPLMEAAPAARIVFTTDEVGHDAKAFWGAYSASKFGIEGLAGTLADELEKSPMDVRLVNPGPTLTPLRKRIFPGETNHELKSPESLSALYLQAIY